MNDILNILDIRKLDINLMQDLSEKCGFWGNNGKIDLIKEFNCAPKFTVFLKSLFFSIKTSNKKTNYLNCFLNNGGMGKVAISKNNEVVGIVLYGDYCLFPSLKQFSNYPPDFESAFLGYVYIDRDFNGFGLEERLLLSVEKDLKEKQYKSIETIAKRANDDISEEDFDNIHFFTAKFLISKGFYIKKNDELYPLLRMDLKNIVTIPEEESWFYKLFVKRQVKRSSVAEVSGKIKK
ncbi:MAG: hypothetical protein PHU65_07060 [Actinomycetota bacterium]|nr:hypothetical protein [Actinomycetota bacterium]